MLETGDGLQLRAFNLRDVVGRTIECEDGVKRRVEQISYSQRYADKVLINEVNEDETPGGSWCHVLSLSCQMHGNPVPTEEQKKAFTRVAKALRWQPDPSEGGPGFVRTPSGIIIPH